MHKSKINKISLAVCLAFMPIYGLAAGLGKLSVDSGLGEPLKAQIDLISVTPDELSSLTASVASEEAYAIQGITRLGVHGSIKVELAKNPDGSPVLKLRSQQPIDDPYLDMLIQVDWASGRLLREYTILLDPPGYKQAINDGPLSKSVFNPAYVPPEPNAQTATAPDAQQMHEVTPRLVDKDKRKKKTAPTSSNKESDTQTETSVAVNATDELLTKRGDTLHSIAKDVQVEGVSLDQMLVGLFNANKNAFVDGNMNRLKVGQIVKIPSKEDLTALSQQQAAKEIKVHSENWNAYRNNLAGNVLAANVEEDTESKQSASGKIVSAEDKAAPVKSGPQDVVKLSAGGKVAAQGGKVAAEADAKILAMQEEATAREKALKESQERSAALEAQLADMQKLLSLKSQALADVQKNAESAIKSPETQKPVAADPSTPAPAPVAAEAVVQAAETAAPQTVAPAVPEPVKAQPAAEAVKKPAVAKAPVQPEPEEEDSFLSMLLESVNLFMLAGAGGLTLLGAGWVYMRNKRRKDLDSFERGILTSGGLRANTVFGNTTGNATSSADTSFLTDFAQSADGGMIDTNDVDPIAEAEVYMAYGRDAQAEEILKDAISKEPKRYELHLKLLEMYAARKDASAFETIAGELYTTLGADDPIWAQIATLGTTVEPDNPLYDMSRITPAASAAIAQSRKSDLDENEMDISQDLDFSFDKPKSNTTAETDMQPTLSDSEPSSQETTAQNQFESVQFEQNAFASDVNDETSSVAALDFSAPVDSTATAESKAAADNSMDFDFPDLGALSLNAEEKADSEENIGLAEVDSTQPDNVPVFELPASSASEEIEFAAPASSEQSNALSGFDFNFTAEPSEQVQEVVAEPAVSDFNFEGFTSVETPADEEKPESSALNAMDINFEGFDTSVAASDEPNEQAPVIEGISLDLGGADAAIQAADNNDEISFDFPLTDESESELSNDEVVVPNPSQAGNFDFSAISLDLSDAHSQTEPTVAAQIPVEDSAAEAVAVPTVENENPDVDIKLDLVKVYIDMEDIEGARDLLDEVLKEGGPQQRLKAEELLKSLA